MQICVSLSLLSSCNRDQLLTGAAETGSDAQPLTDAGFAAIVRLVADVADAAVASSQVLAYAVLTDVWVQGALVDVWGRRCISSIKEQSLISENGHVHCAHSPLPSVVMPIPLLHTAWNSAARRGGFQAVKMSS